ncbi:hypothetical protein AB5I41_23815 [Sphingomonas sp. MMS24-JH45]
MPPAAVAAEHGRGECRRAAARGDAQEPDEQMLDDASATGMTARASREEADSARRRRRRSSADAPTQNGPIFP